VYLSTNLRGDQLKKTGFVDTPWQKAKPSAQRRRIESKTALGRFADPREVAEVSAAILKNEYMTGSVVEISGGYGLR
jgi:NAD(P)-dependent dehydrogenase (short-subunit alcohol dehydrogenase family)